jgi:hypothetical protein
METQSSKLLKQSGFSEHPSEKNKEHIRAHPQRYPSQYDESSVRTDITEADIMNYVKRVANKANEKNDNAYCQNKLCDDDVTVEDCPQNQCYKNYLNPENQKINESKKIFFDNFKDIITSQPATSYQEEPDSYFVAKSRVDDLLANRQPKCDVNLVETPLLENTNPSNGICSNANPNGCDRVTPNQDCGNRECYKKYLADDLVSNSKEQQPSQQVRVRFNETEANLPRVTVTAIKAEEYHPIKKIQTSTAEKTDFQKKYNTLIVNSDIAVPEFIDVLIVVSEKPIKISLPQLQGPTLVSSVGNVTSSSNLLIKNLSLCSHQIVTKGSNKIDTVRTSVAIEPAGKKMLGAVNDSWILL